MTKIRGRGMKGRAGRSALVLFAVSALALGCSKDKKSNKKGSDEQAEKKSDGNASRARLDSSKGNTNAAKLTNPDFFQFIPADAAFVFASFEPLPDAFAQKMGDVMVPFRDLFLKEGANETEPGAIELHKRLTKVLTMDGLAGIGIDVTPRYAIYNIGASYVGRVELLDGDKLRAFAEESAKVVGEGPIPFKTMGDTHYVDFSEGPITIAIGVSKTELSFGFMPSSIKDKVMPVLFGAKKPAKSIVETDELRRVVADIGGAYGAGYLKPQSLLKLFTDGADGIAGTPLSLANMDPSCKGDLDRLLGIAPLMRFSYDSITGQEFSMVMDLTLRDDIAAKLSSVAMGVPAYEVLRDRKAAMSFGVGVDYSALQGWVAEIAQGLEVAPYKCPELSELPEVVADMSQGMEVAASMIRNIGGLSVLVDNVDVKNPSNITGAVAVHSKEPGPLWKLISGFTPGLAGIELAKDGTPTTVPLAPLQAMGITAPVKVAIGPKMIAATLGEGMDGLLGSLANGDSKKSNPFMTMAYDYSTMLANLPMDGNGEDPETAALIKRAFESFGTVSFEAHAQKPGLVFRYVFQLK